MVEWQSIDKASYFIRLIDTHTDGEKLLSHASSVGIVSIRLLPVTLVRLRMHMRACVCVCGSSIFSSCVCACVRVFTVNQLRTILKDQLKRICERME